MRDRSVTIGGMSKTYAVTGWRVGTIIAPARLTHTFRQIHDYVRSARPLRCKKPARSPIVCHARITISSPRIIRQRRDRFCLALQEIGFDLEPPEGAYYVMADFSAFSDADDVAFARHLVPPSASRRFPAPASFETAS